jgi:hypothetical protein
MGLSVQKGTVNVTGSVTANVSGLAKPSATQTVITILTSANGGTQNVYTVTAGKNFYLTGVLHCGDVAGGINIFKTDGSTVVAKVFGTLSLSQSYTPSTPIWVYQSTEIVKANGTNTLSYIITGYEE